jgi:hypothetical protein
MLKNGIDRFDQQALPALSAILVPARGITAFPQNIVLASKAGNIGVRIVQ